MTPEERAAAIGAQFPAGGIQYSYLGIVFAVSGCVVSGPAVTVTIAAWTGAGHNRVTLPTDNPYVFVNPPLKVPDGGTDAGGSPTFSRSDLAAAQQIVYDAVTAAARRLGWTP